MAPHATGRSDVALFIPDVAGGGAERVMVQVARELAAREHRVDLVLGRARGRYLAEIPSDVRVVELGVDRALACLPGLVRHLRVARPSALLSTMNHVNPVAITAARLAQTGARVVVREASNLSGQVRDSPTLRGRLTPVAIRVTYPWADAVVAVSQAAKHDLVERCGLAADGVSVIYNPVDFEAVRLRATEPTGHPWLDDADRRVVLAVGRLSPEKGFDVLLDAFAKLETGPRLVICGEGDERQRLEAKVAELGVESRVDLVGFVNNPYAYLARCEVLVLPSRWEGLPNVLIHALALDAKVVATDCPGGTAEILDGGKWGSLVPVDDREALRAALSSSLATTTAVTPSPHWRARFDTRSVIDQYEEILALSPRRSAR